MPETTPDKAVTRHALACASPFVVVAVAAVVAATIVTDVVDSLRLLAVALMLAALGGVLTWCICLRQQIAVEQRMRRKQVGKLQAAYERDHAAHAAVITALDARMKRLEAQQLAEHITTLTDLTDGEVIPFEKRRR